MHQKDRIQLRNALHAFAQRPRVAGRELIDAAGTHEGLEPDRAAFDERSELIEISWHEPAPKAEVDAGRTPHRAELEIERRCGRGHRQIVERHVDEGRVAAGGQRGRPVRDVLPLGATWLVEVNVRINAAGEDMKSGCVDLFTAGR